MIMEFLEAVHLTELESGLILLVLVLAGGLIYLRCRGVRSTETRGHSIEFEGLKEWVKESELICETLSKNLQEKRKIAKRLMAQLDGKLAEMNDLLSRIDEKGPLPSEEVKGRDVHSVIVEMAESGCHVSQIARWLKIPEGEVQLVLDLKKFGHREDLQPQTSVSQV